MMRAAAAVMCDTSGDGRQRVGRDVSSIIIGVRPSKTQPAAVVVVIARSIDSNRSCQRRHEFVVLPRERAPTQGLGRRPPRGEGGH